MQTLTGTELYQLLDYDPITGFLYWKPRNIKGSWNSRYAGKRAFTFQDKSGYYRGSIHNKMYLAHRVIFMMLHGCMPEQVDHKDQNPSNNCPDNLLDSNAHLNSQNSKKYVTNTTGYTGVIWDTERQKWRAQITIHSKTKILGRFSSFDEAVSARKIAETYHKFNPNHGA